MDISNNPNFKPMNILKIGAVVLVAIIAIAIFFRIIASSFSSLSSGMDERAGTGQYPVNSKPGKAVSNMPELSLRNAAQSGSLAYDAGSPSGNAEEMEIREYTATVETRRLQEDCGKIADLKARPDVVFENATQYQRGCDYYFKVKRESVPEILGIVKGLDPRDLNENAQSIKKQVDDFTSESEILEKKIASIESTLSDAVKAYDEIAVLATKVGNAESLTKIIDSKIGIIERLTQQRISANAELERLRRAKSEQLDRLEYTYFNVHIYENRFVDMRNIADSWKAAVRSFVMDVNRILQDISINLIALFLLIIQYLLYFFILLVVGKYVWQTAKRIWMK